MPNPIPCNTGLTDAQVLDAFTRAIGSVQQQPGKGLSDENYTAAEKEAVGNIGSTIMAHLLSVVGTARRNILKNTASSTTKSGVTYTVNSDGSVTANGTATAQSLLKIGTVAVPEESRFTISGCPENGSNSTYELYCRDSNGYVSGTDDFGGGKTFTRALDFDVYITIKSGYTASDLTFYPMVRYAAVQDSTYEQYRPSIEERLAALESRDV